MQSDEQRSYLSLDCPLFYGRSFAEYRAMFALEAEDWIGKRMLDCPGGPSSFVAEANELRCEACAADLLYGRGYAELRERGERDLLTVATQVTRIAGTPRASLELLAQQEREQRRHVLGRFLEDYVRWGQRRYVQTELPALPFHAQQFDIALSGYLLFRYSHLLDYEFHLATLRALARVARVVRVYPIHDQTGAPYAHLDQLLQDLTALHLRSEITPVKRTLSFMRPETALLCLSSV